MSDASLSNRPFYLTMPAPCPYLPDQLEQRVVSELRRDGDGALFDRLSEAGFRRSMGWMYRPACPFCQACVPVRIPAADFAWTRGFRKTLKRSADLTFEEQQPRFEEEHYELFRRYVASRHGDGGMAHMGVAEYREMVESSPGNAMLVTFRDVEGKLVAASLTDRLRSGLSGVYKYFEPEMDRRSLGTFIILWHIRRCIEIGLDHVYLGYWIADCRKMAYKTRFRPLEAMTRDGWRPFDQASASTRE